jgi:quercetin dioxygenase-like cupin family protein
MITEKRKFVLNALSEVQPFRFEGMDIRPLVQKEDTENMVAYHIRIPPRTKVPHSYHKDACEVIYVLDGEGDIYLDHVPTRMKASDSVFIQPRVWHSFETGDREMTVLAVLTPRADPKTDLYHR